MRKRLQRNISAPCQTEVSCECDGLWQECFYDRAAATSAWEAAGVKWVVRVVHDGQQFVEWPQKFLLCRECKNLPTRQQKHGWYKGFPTSCCTCGMLLWATSGNNPLISLLFPALTLVFQFSLLSVMMPRFFVILNHINLLNRIHRSC